MDDIETPVLKLYHVIIFKELIVKFIPTFCDLCVSPASVKPVFIPWDFERKRGKLRHDS